MQSWSIKLTLSRIYLMNVGEHELNLALGLSHSNVRDALMFSSYSMALRSLNKVDTGRIQSIYCLNT
ncbi:MULTISPECIES: matrixin family metalloprotease [Bacillus cereus group]|nr:matrixin family metalloprotease [Bacillus thuringiensis]